MDPLTHGLLGATIGQAVGARRLGWRPAATWGALAAMAPDLDMLAVPFGGALGEFRFHRAATHALWLMPLFGLGLAEWLWRRGHSNDPRIRSAWRCLLVLACSSHPLLDWMTTYGIQMFWPLPWRGALDAVPIIDLLYTGILLVAAVAGAFRRGLPGDRVSVRVAGAALVLSSVYLGYGYGLNLRAERVAREQLEAAGWRTETLTAHPTLLQPWLRRVVARSGRELRVGFWSAWAPGPIAWRGFSVPAEPWPPALIADADARLFRWFALDHVAWSYADESGRRFVELDDLRFGFGDAPEQGLWGVRWSWDGKTLGPAQRFNRPRPPLSLALQRLWDGTFRGVP